MSKSLNRKFVCTSACVCVCDYYKTKQTRCYISTSFLHQIWKFLWNFGSNSPTESLFVCDHNGWKTHWSTKMKLDIWFLHPDCRYVYTLWHRSAIVPASLYVRAYECQRHFEPKVYFWQSTNFGRLRLYQCRSLLSPMITFATQMPKVFGAINYEIANERRTLAAVQIIAISFKTSQANYYKV